MTKKKSTWICARCKKKFNTHRGFTVHQKICNYQPKVHKCNACGTSYKTLKGLQKHQMSPCAPPTCPKCGKTFRSKGGLHGHMNGAQFHPGVPSCVRKKLDAEIKEQRTTRLEWKVLESISLMLEGICQRRQEAEPVFDQSNAVGGYMGQPYPKKAPDKWNDRLELRADGFCWTLRLQDAKLHIHDIHGPEVKESPLLAADPEFFAKVRNLIFNKLLKEARSRIRSARSIITNREKVIETIKARKKEPAEV